MKKILLAGAAATLVLAGCSGAENETTEAISTADIAEAPSSYAIEGQAMEAPPPPSSASGSQIETETISGGGEIPVGTPQVAYRYAYGFRLPSEAIRSLQERHADMCEAKGPDACRIISMDQAENEGDYAYGSLTLAVRARDARSFGKELASASGKVDGELVSSSIEGEDLSKRIVDTEARLRARTVLRDRLMDVLRNRRGTVAELVEAERGVAQVNEEIDQAQSWLTEMRGRVAYSNMTVTYESGKPATGGFAEPIRSAWNSLGGIFGTMISVLIVLLAVLVPLGLLVWLGMRAWRRLGLSTGIGRNGWLPEAEPAAKSD
ncbi:DUF4349 domain-containing protein [Qipengyuania qiaonensis]|uniref:DUF4349 domain-containing protein n=1 Tax=Qipengyuania qiaonensis TaxID=2867240 RepID=A0ABS7J8Q1_9SPHN|nr:DUF4349 domain-containing protein [Qipengyuania qiaonensis]MBX7483701.1 DUF4349 domain-containing protein [Qipengyuania qiaonensis]